MKHGAVQHTYFVAAANLAIRPIKCNNGPETRQSESEIEMRHFDEWRSGDGGGGVDPDGVTPLLLSAAAATNKIEIRLLVIYHFEPLLSSRRG